MLHVIMPLISLSRSCHTAKLLIQNALLIFSLHFPSAHCCGCIDVRNGPIAEIQIFPRNSFKNLLRNHIECHEIYPELLVVDTDLFAVLSSGTKHRGYQHVLLADTLHHYKVLASSFSIALRMTRSSPLSAFFFFWCHFPVECTDKSSAVKLNQFHCICLVSFFSKKAFASLHLFILINQAMIVPLKTDRNTH